MDFGRVTMIVDRDLHMSENVHINATEWLSGLYIQIWPETIVTMSGDG